MGFCDTTGHDFLIYLNIIVSLESKEKRVCSHVWGIFVRRRIVHGILFLLFLRRCNLSTFQFKSYKFWRGLFITRVDLEQYTYEVTAYAWTNFREFIVDVDVNIKDLCFSFLWYQLGERKI